MGTTIPKAGAVASANLNRTGGAVDVATLSRTFADVVSSKLRLAPGVAAPKNADGTPQRLETVRLLGAAHREQQPNGVIGSVSATLYTLTKTEVAKLDPAVQPFLLSVMNGPARTMPGGNKVGGGVIEAWTGRDVVALFSEPFNKALQGANTNKGFLSLPFTKQARTLDAKEQQALKKSLPETLSPMLPEAMKWTAAPATFAAGEYLKTDLIPYFKASPTRWYGPNPGQSPSKYVSDVRVTEMGITLVIPKDAPKTVDYLGYGGGIHRTVDLEVAIKHELANEGDGKLNLSVVRK